MRAISSPEAASLGLIILNLPTQALAAEDQREVWAKTLYQRLLIHCTKEMMWEMKK
jgi:hypothetical protein